MTGINGDYGKFNNNIFNNNNKNVENKPQKQEVKEAIDFKSKAPETKDLGDKLITSDSAAFYNAMGVTLSKPSIDKAFTEGLDAKTLKYLNGATPEVAARIGKSTTNIFAALETIEEFA